MKFKTIVQLVLVSLVVTTMVVLNGCATREQLREQERELSEVRADLKETQALLQEKNNLIEELRKEVERLDGRVGELTSKLEEAREEKEQLQAEQERLEDLQQQNEELQDKLSEVKEAKTTIERDNLVVTLESQILFDLGKAKLKPQARETLNKIADAFAKYEDRPIAVEGHTDNLPIQTERFPSNWHLSAARAVSVIQYLTDEHDITPKRFIAVGLGEHHPEVPNTSAENRQQNRRVEIVLYPPGIGGQYQTSGQN